MTPGTRIETPRMTLRTVTMDDLEDVIHSWRLDGEPIPRDEAQQRIANMLENHCQNARGRLAYLCMAMIDRESQAFMGWCGLDHRDETAPHPVLFYVLG